MYRPKVYTASKIHHRLKWLTLVEDFPQIEFTARWLEIDASGGDHATGIWTEDQKRLHWLHDEQDVKRSDYVLAFKDKEDKLSGTLIECGIGLGAGKIILPVGFTEWDSWQAHPLVIPQFSCISAIQFILGVAE